MKNTIKVKTKKGKERLIADMNKRAMIAQAIKDKKPFADIEKEFDVKFVMPI